MKHQTNNFLFQVLVFSELLSREFKQLLNPFNATGLLLYPLKTSENLYLSDVFRGYRRRPVA